MQRKSSSCRLLEVVSLIKGGGEEDNMIIISYHLVNHQRLVGL